MRTFTWVDGLVDADMASSIADAHFSDVVLRRLSYDEMNDSITNLYPLKVWQHIFPVKLGDVSVDWLRDEKAKFQGLDIEGYYVDDLQILSEEGLSKLQDAINLFYEVLGENVIFVCLNDWGRKISPIEVENLEVKHLDYYSWYGHDYLSDPFPKNLISKGIYLWLFETVHTVPLDAINNIYHDAQELGAERLTAWQWYFAGEYENMDSYISSINTRPELVERITECNEKFLNGIAIERIEPISPIPALAVLVLAALGLYLLWR